MEAWRSLEVDLRRAASPGGRADSGRFSLEGTRLHERAVESGTAVERAMISQSYGESTSSRVRALIAGLISAGTEVHIAPDEVVARLTGGRGNGDVLGLVRIPEAPPLSQLFQGEGPERRTVLVGVEVEEPGNVGAMVRTAAASGCIAFVGVGITDPFHPKAVRTSMGNLFKRPVVRARDVQALVTQLDALGVQKVGATSTGGLPLPSAEFSEQVAVFMGSEAFGLPADVTAAMDALVTIPMAPDVSSFSVNAAAAVMLYEVRRSLQRSDRP